MNDDDGDDFADGMTIRAAAAVGVVVCISEINKKKFAIFIFFIGN